MSTTLKRNRGSPKKTVTWANKNGNLLFHKRNANMLPNARAYRKGLQKNNYKTNKKNNNNNVPIPTMTAEEVELIKSHSKKYVTSRKAKKTNKNTSVLNTPKKNRSKKNKSNIVITNNIKKRQEKFQKNMGLTA